MVGRYSDRATGMAARRATVATPVAVKVEAVETPVAVEVAEELEVLENPEEIEEEAPRGRGKWGRR